VRLTSQYQLQIDELIDELLKELKFERLQILA
jgi:hypothetical protein